MPSLPPDYSKTTPVRATGPWAFTVAPVQDQKRLKSSKADGFPGDLLCPRNNSQLHVVSLASWSVDPEELARRGVCVCGGGGGWRLSHMLLPVTPSTAVKLDR